LTGIVVAAIVVVIIIVIVIVAYKPRWAGAKTAGAKKGPARRKWAAQFPPTHRGSLGAIAFAFTAARHMYSPSMVLIASYAATAQQVHSERAELGGRAQAIRRSRFVPRI
jgi:hypothetical protein